MYALLEKDEETDSSVFAAYLRAQSDGDLLDILLHLDPERYPARVDAARRETLRRHVLPVTVHTTEERFFRGLALVALSLAGLTVLLTILLTPTDAAGPPWLADDQWKDGILVSTLMRLALLDILRLLVVISVHLALAPLALLTLGGWLLARARHRAIRADVKRLVLAACLILVVAFLLAAAPFSSVPALFDPSAVDAGFWGRALTLLNLRG
ncbi:MAG: hypothetical protein JO250_12530 [Armatimonadetes bacterium]|nr:hypothetical protein [Armatimonadota bacterium]